jgi:UPF0271 protein
MPTRIDLNCDLGESFGPYRIGNDEALMGLITSANIACGYHAGDPSVMDRTVRLAVEHGVAIGAHPGFPDLVGFGRRPMRMDPEEIENDVLYQVGALAAFAHAAGSALAHVKPHGALYNMAAADIEVARAIARAVRRAGPNLILVGLAGSALIAAAEEAGLCAASEGFADRAYEVNGTLRSRHLPGAVLHSPDAAAKQALQIARDGSVTSHSGQRVPLRVDTLCIHGDNPRAVEIVQAIRRKLTQAGIEVKPCTPGRSSSPAPTPKKGRARRRER